MGTIKNIWKRFKKLILWMLGFLGFSGIVTIAKAWNDIWMVISAIGKFLISTNGRQVILLSLIVGLFIWLVILSRKVKKLSHPKRDVGDVDTFMKTFKKRTEKKEIEVKPEYIFILEEIGGMRSKRREQEGLYIDYRNQYKFANDKEANVSFNMAIEFLNKNDYIIKEQVVDGLTDVYFYYQITTEGFEYLRLAKKKIEEEKKPL